MSEDFEATGPMVQLSIEEAEKLVDQGKAKRMFVNCPGCATKIAVKGYYLLVGTGETVGPAPKGGIYA